MKLAIVGAGPSAFYVASRILSRAPESIGNNLRIHLFDRLWSPHGLVRYGVAPDHPEVKNCTNKFDATAEDPRFRFFGNVNIGSSGGGLSHYIRVPLSSVLRNYTHVLFATGCTSPILHPSLPLSQHCVPALSLVHWYTLHPSRPEPPPLDKLSHVTVVGQGNVALDVARMLLTPPEALAKYDVPESVLSVLKRSKVEHVSIVGRRGPFEAAFTTKELREMMQLPDASMVPLDEAVFASQDPKIKLTRQQSRLIQLLKQGSTNSYGSTRKTWSLDFFRSPMQLTPPATNAELPLAQLHLAHTTLDPISRSAVLTGEISTSSTSLVVTSLGFRAEADSEHSPFYDAKLGHLRAQSGRLLSANGAIYQNLYASGWAATGAKGVLASTMVDAYAVADTIISDCVQKQAVIPSAMDTDTEMGTNPSLDSDRLPLEVQSGIDEGLVTEYTSWKEIDEMEMKRGSDMGKERERMGWSEARLFLLRTKYNNP